MAREYARFDLPPDTPLGEAADLVQAHLFEGSICSCCAQIAMARPRSIHGVVAAGLVACVRIFTETEDWVDVKEINAALEHCRSGTANPTSDFATLRHWGLAFSCPSDNPKKRSSGLWKPTRDGILFAHGCTFVKKHAYVYNKECLHLGGDWISIRDALATDFDYREVAGMGAPPHREGTPHEDHHR